MKTIAGWAFFLSAMLGTAPAQIVDEVPRQTAMTWLLLVDDQKYAESWKTASALFQKAIAEAEWIQKIGESRKPLGRLKRRDFVQGRYLRDPDGMPPGEYFALEFAAVFESKAMRELVVPRKDETGLWQVSYYSLAPAMPASPSK